MTDSGVRRSSRARSQATSAYDLELVKLAEKKASQDSDSEISEKLEELANAMKEEDAEADSFSEDEEDFKPASTQKAKVKPPSHKKASRPIQVKIGAKKPPKVDAKNAAKNKSRKGVQNSLKFLSRKVLDSSETPETSLVAALLASYKPIPGIESSTPRSAPGSMRESTIYSPQLEGIARKLLQDHEPNSMHMQLLNLLFRSVGGSVETNLPPGTDLEELDDSEWDTIVTDVVEVMRDTEIELLTANPEDRVGPKEYRAIYEEFWYRLGAVILSHTHGTNDPQEFSSNRFQVEMLRDLVARVTELVLVGQPDLRAGATMAIWQLAISCMERTVEMELKLATAQRQYNASKGQSRKLQALQHNMDTWRRHKEELEEIVEGPVMQGVFIHRYRDSNPHIRVCSLDTLSALTLLRPDLMLRDKYLKYFGWMASDKVDVVRMAALKGLHAPFRAIHKKDNTKRPANLEIEIRTMQNVLSKFLSRIVDCTADAQSLEVQELAMKLLLAMLKEEFLDEWEDDNGWDQINLKALDPNATPATRKDALYFILEQLDCFDTDDDNRSFVSSQTASDRKQVERIEGIASWIANKLCDGPVDIDHIAVDRTDFVIESLRDMPEHKHLVVNWSTMLKAIRSENPQQGRAVGREELAKQRVLLQMLACSAKLEVKALTEPVSKTKKRKQDNASNDHPRETLSVALLKSLPQLLIAFKGDVMALRSLTNLPRYLISEVFSLPARKSDFQSLVKNLCSLFLESTDEEVLQNVSQALSLLVQGDHARVPDVKMQMKRLSSMLQDRLMDLFQESDPQNLKSPKPSKKKTTPKRKSPRSTSSSASSVSSESMLSASPEVEIEHSIYLCLLRFRILIKLCPLTFLFNEAEGDDDEEEVEDFSTTISEALGKRLQDRLCIVELDDQSEHDAKTVTLPDIWRTANMAIHSEVAKCVAEGLQVLLVVLAWKLVETLESRNASNNETDEVDPEEMLVLRMRDRLNNLLGLCFDQYLEEREGLVYSDEQVEFSNSVQASAGRVASDVRTSFPREWAKAKDPVRRSLALIDDSQLIGGFARFLQSREHELREITEGDDEVNEERLVHDLLMPLARSLTANWTDGNRKEAGILLAHVTGSGLEAAQVVHHTIRMLKRINPVRFLEAQMACLRMSFEHWINSEPEELETEHPTAEQLEEFAEYEKKHEALFHTMEQQASRLSMALGVGKITDGTLSRALVSFMQEGVRFAFEGNRTEDDDLVLGSRLPFLLVLSKYSTWIKKKKAQLVTLKNFLAEKVAALEAHPEFDDVHDDDIAALEKFKESLGLQELRRRRTQTAEDDMTTEDQPGNDSTPSPAVRSTGSKRRISTAGSQRSKLSTQSNLSPLYEDESEAPGTESKISPSPQKRRRLVNSLSENGTIEEGDGSEGESMES